ncbi:predicted protein [Nematostella vectensis]|uniref:RNA polymerase-associated protein LEO1 n=1 Tax=Nematostella vectensis TaxID=45351 RepID=A7RUX9_NEMVE|nr:RNA polymerase-associated protein LEO1 [Nematostella vectensis]EDO44827.1 predicted protein [Nematostella vectensis]|eukprot:XP_001636890.1 predicted protein [Nematostella vectensis]
MSLEDVFGSDLDDSEDEDRAKSARETDEKARMNELFGDSPSEGEDEDKELKDSESRGRSDEDSGDEKESGKNEGSYKGQGDSENDQDMDQDSTSSKQKVSHADLFGEDEELSSDEEKEDNAREVESKEETQARVPREEGEEEEEEEETRIDVTIPYCRVALGSELYFSKLPNFLSLETKPFDPALYEDDVEDDEILDEEGRARLKLKVENTIRWRYGKYSDDNEIKESNARIVRWSDGSLSLLVGAEVFDIQKTRIEGDFNHLFVQQGTGLQGQAVFKEKLTFRPHSTASQTHRKMTLSIADRALKAQKIKMLPAAGQDPEAQRSEMIKKEEERLRSQLRLENQQRRMRERSQARGLNSSYLEAGEDDDEDLEQSLLKIKKKYKEELAKGAYSSEEDDGEEEGLGDLESDNEGEERLMNAKEGKDSEEESIEEPSRKRLLSEGNTRKEKKKTKKIIESSDNESD